MRSAAPLFLLLALALLPAAPVQAQDFAGEWEMTRETPRGTTTRTLTLTRTDEGWTGTMSFMQRTLELSDVKIEGNVLSFTMEVGPPEGRGGPPGRQRGTMAQTFRGTLEGDSIDGEIEGPRGPMPMVLTRKKD